jgi:hypothetical protein
MHPASGAFRGVLRRLRQGLPYCAVLCVCGVHVNVFAYTAIRRLLTSPIFMKTTNAEQHYVRISDTEFYPNRTITVRNKGRSAFTYQVKQAVTAPSFTKLALLGNIAQRTVLLRFTEVRQETCRVGLLYTIVALSLS